MRGKRNREREREGWLANGRRPQFSGNWKTTSIFWQMEDNLNYLLKQVNLIFLNM